MDMLEFLRTRRTYRRFEQRPVAPEILTEAVDAARIASCGANRQTVRYIVVQSADAVAAVQPLVHWAAYLPPEQGQPKPDELPTAFIAVLQDDNLPGTSEHQTGLAVDIVSAEKEDGAYLTMAEDIIPKIIDAQTSEVDTISGATFSSTGIKNATAQALESAQ